MEWRPEHVSRALWVCEEVPPDTHEQARSVERKEKA